MSQFIRKSTLVLIAVLVAAKLFFSVAIFLYPRISLDSDLPVSAAHLLALTNEYRLTQNLNALQPNTRLNQAALNKARDLLSGQYFNHTSPAGRRFSDWIREVGYQYFYVGENLAIDFKTDEEVFRAWLDSPTHYANIVKPQYQEIGLSTVKGKYKNHEAIVVVQLFGTRVLGESESVFDDRPLSDLLADYTPNFWGQIAELQTLVGLGQLTGWALVFFLAFYLITYRPQPHSRPINTKQPIISRYHAKPFRE